MTVFCVWAALLVIGSVTFTLLLIRLTPDTPDDLVCRGLSKAPLTSIAALREGQDARIQGIIVSVDTPIRAPLSGRPCVFFEDTKQIWTATGGQGGRDGSPAIWRVVARTKGGVSFWIDDGSGRIRVKLDPQNANGTDARLVCRRFDPLDGEILSEETVLEEGDEVAAAGTTRLGANARLELSPGLPLLRLVRARARYTLRDFLRHFHCDWTAEL